MGCKITFCRVGKNREHSRFRFILRVGPPAPWRSHVSPHSRVAYRVDLQPAPGGVAPGGVLLDGVAIEFCGRPFFTAPSLKIRRVRLLELSKWRAQTTEKSYLHVQIVDGTLRLSSLGASLTRSFMFPTPIKQNPHLIVVRAINIAPLKTMGAQPVGPS